MKKTVLFILWMALPLLMVAQVTLPKVISDNMVLQQGKKVNIWGEAAPGERVIVKFQRQTKKTVADEQGRWSVQLDELKATHKPQQMTVRGKKNTIRLKNILIGEVWLASGQSNMEYSMNNHPKYAKAKKGNPNRLKEEFEQANSPIIRLMYVKKELKSDTLPSNGWQTLSQETLAPMSAAGYFFAKRLVEELDVPVGIISTSWGGTRIETWTPEEAYAESPLFKEKLKEHKIDGHRVGERFYKMVEPMIPFTLKGFLWYQGESNLIDLGPTDNYYDKKKTLIECWRKAWKDDALPFYYVQISPYTYSTRRGDFVANAWDALPRFWEEQTRCLQIPKTGMVVTTDLVDNVKDIHPSYKWTVGERLARLALAKDYGKTETVFCGPTYKSLKVEGKKVVIEFDHTYGGLKTSDGKAPDWFTVKLNNGRYSKPQSAYIEENRVVLTHERLDPSGSVRFAWDELAMPNLINGEGLPALPFRTSGE
ncbi:MAG: hypothetical protein IJ417_07070 [Bacteroidaceae bacterium]|nr:hypothetical protein [Bacteroidaceae bacterium]